MPINSKPLASARENRSNYNEWKSIWDSYKNSKDYQTLTNYEETLGSTYNPISRVDSYINQDIPTMMKADSLVNVRGNTSGHPVMGVPKVSDSTRKMVDEFIAMPTEDKKALMKFFGDEFIDKEWGTAKENTSTFGIMKSFAKNPTLLKYLPFAKRLLNTFSSFGEQAPPLYNTKENYLNGYDPVSMWNQYIEKNE